MEVLGCLPPVLPPLQDQVEEYLLTPELLPIHSAANSRKWFPRVPDPHRLYTLSPLPPGSHLEVERDTASGEITGVREVASRDAGATAKNSLSLSRAPGPPEEVVRGSTTNYPFWPGGFPEPEVDTETVEGADIFDPENFLSSHPRLSGGITFGEAERAAEEKNIEDEQEGRQEAGLVVNLADILTEQKIFEVDQQPSKKGGGSLSLEGLSQEEASLVQEFSIEPPPPRKQEFVLDTSSTKASPIIARNTEWAENIDINAPVDDFAVRVPNPACTYPFELDTFQKQAVLHLEQNDCVFVAAHTSAGKTVVAEYAVALSLKHMTRAVYTSPIKALSNQKYRDFKVKFEDVGLLTGDIQINPKASCLIMTTEILQSMLYNGSDLIRDLEWVIFDEVHYINNAERGHVWEEVLIMLPSTVSIVLLSATVPNTIEFADWIGRIKKRKIYVISTLQRPVPLEHFLYTGTGGRSKDDRFLLVDARSTFVTKGYNDALAAKSDKNKKGQQMHGPRQGRQHLGEKQEKNLWVGLLDHLVRRDLLPVVAFTLSKKRCDSNAHLLLSQDLTTSREKGEIYTFIRRCTDRLQGSDKKLPQVLHMRTLLKQGIGVHHSGILPILKEVVEMLFAKGLVKLLFATETFAMGVNMPARCVIFDSIRKHDGTAFRDLVPSEYIQMAGRAGRRGLDTTGTVMVLCKSEVPEMSDLHRMMLGKPSKLESKFKITYSMMLRILRVESMTVEDIMKRSFSEAVQMANQSKYQKELEQIEARLASEPEFSCLICKDIKEYYAIARDYTKQRRHVYTAMMGFLGVVKAMSPGRLLVVSHGQYQQRLACLLKLDQRDQNKLTVFVLRGKEEVEALSGEEIQRKEVLAASQTTFEVLEDTSGHTCLEVPPGSVAAITAKTLKISADKVIANVKKRLIPRFKDDPPSQSVQDLVNQMQRLNESHGEDLPLLSLLGDLGVREMKAVGQVHSLECQRSKVMDRACLECPMFQEHFGQAFKRLNMEERAGRLRFLMSEEALQLHPEYKMRTQVLQQLGYIEQNKTVTLKGRVACEMGSHELMVTELVMENVFGKSPAKEIAALLSCMVFQQRNCSEPALTPELKSGMKQFKEVAENIGVVQQECGLLEPVGDFVDQFNFGLIEVVYQWACGMPFNKIMELTDVQEGITVKCIQRLDEVLKDVKNAAHIIGDPNLREKMEAASAAIKRDIVFTPSLYTQ
ncbi:Helicase SKI2W [Chionoecetes opilio]|uniref:Helicase SKI2W n=1 Tax=Chionoecetes opilio TaxID=41210 RepID=A0A8J4XRD6_CHIOP|nr:Helicase SKI2W [Chionoecetes opilio]